VPLTRHCGPARQRAGWCQARRLRQLFGTGRPTADQRPTNSNRLLLDRSETGRAIGFADADAVSVVGCGMQGRTHLFPLLEHMPRVRRVALHDHHGAPAVRLAGRVSAVQPDIAVSGHAEAEPAVNAGVVVVFTTTRERHRASGRDRPAARSSSFQRLDVGLWCAADTRCATAARRVVPDPRPTHPDSRERNHPWPPGCAERNGLHDRASLRRVRLRG